MKTIPILLKQWLRVDYKRGLKQLEYNCKMAFSINPHNRFKGSAKAYIKEYRLNLELRGRLLKHWLDFTDGEVNQYIIAQKIKQYKKG